MNVRFSCFSSARDTSAFVQTPAGLTARPWHLSAGLGESPGDADVLGSPLTDAGTLLQHSQIGTEEGSGMGRKAWLSIAAAFLLGVGTAVTVSELAEPSSGVTVSRTPPADEIPRTRQALVSRWEKSLADAGLKLPEGWEKMSTNQIRTEYVSQELANAGPPPTGPALDPGFKNPDN
ncbi:hypothetical protein AB0J57_02070 [Streptomyces sp. NPDC049837]|uniref:hypothetical protein n=1 Tax=Streptomyces sp. NPDC049837 TaxID=3155277 RepID=UPI00342F089D